MSNQIASMLSRIEAAREKLRPSEEKLANLVLSEPLSVVEMTMDEFAAQAGVSAPTVARFCAAVGCSGFREFKIRLAQDRGYGLPFVHPDVTSTDTVGEIAHKVFERTLREIMAVRNSLSYEGLERAVDVLARASRIEFYGSGNSGIVAQDIQHKFFRLGMPTVAYADPHIFCMSALTLQAGDAVVLLSNSGRNRDILEAAQNAVSVGAEVIAVTHPATLLAQIAHVVIEANAMEDADLYTPMTSRIAQLVLGDILAIGVAQRKGEMVCGRLDRAKDAVRQRRLISE